MAVAPSLMADKIVVLGDDEEDGSRRRSKRVSRCKSQQLAFTHVTQSPYATSKSKKQTGARQAEKEKKQPVSKMTVGPASQADNCIVLEDYKERESPEPALTASTLPAEHKDMRVLLHKAHLPASTLIPRSPLTTAEEQTHILQVENKELFSKFVEHCSALTQDCPEVLTFLQTKFTKASPEYLSSVEFRSTLEQCLTCAKTNHSKTFAFINELCIVLRNRAAKRRQMLTRVESGSSTSSSLQSAFVMLKSKDNTKVKGDDEVEEAGKPAAKEKQPSTSVLPENKEDNKEGQQVLGKQTLYLENLLKVYHKEICRLQRAELSLDDLEAEDSLYIQEHKLKRKMMKIYEKLCELKDCNTLTGRVIEQRIPYTSTRYPEINSRIEHFINSPEVQIHPPDYQDMVQQVLQANKHHKLCLSRKQLHEMALDAFRETGNVMQERRHLDVVLNFGSYLTDSYKPASDPAFLDPALKRKLQLNREVAMSQLEGVFTKYVAKQDDMEDQEMDSRLKKKGNKSNGVDEEELEEEEEEDEEDDEEDYSSDPDIEEEIQASTRQNGLGDDEDEEDKKSTKTAEENPVVSGHGKPLKTGQPVGSFSRVSEDPANFSPALANGTEPPLGSREARIQTRRSKTLTSSNSPNSKHTINNSLSSAEPQEPVVPPRHTSAIVAANGTSSPASVTGKQSRTRTINGTSPRLSPRGLKRKRNGEETSSDSPHSETLHQSDTLMTSSRKRKREETTSQNWPNSECVHCLICHTPQSNISAHLSQVCMKKSTAKERAAECQKAKASSSTWVCANRTWYYGKICELLPHRPSRFAVIQDLLRRGFFVVDLPGDLDADAGEAGDVAIAATSTASTSATVTDPSDSPEATDACGSTEMSAEAEAEVKTSDEPEASAEAEAEVEASDEPEASAEAEAEVPAEALASPSQYTRGRSSCSSSEGVMDCEEVLRLGEQDFVNTFNKLGSNAKLTVKERTTYRYYLEAVLLLRYSQRPIHVTNFNVREWVNRTSAHGKVMIGKVGFGRQKSKRKLIVTITQEEESWFQGYYEYIRPLHIVNSGKCPKFFVTAFGKGGISPFRDLVRLHNMYNFDQARRKVIKKIFEAQAAGVLTETRKKVLTGYLAQSKPVATKHYMVLTPQKAVKNSFTEQSPQEEVRIPPLGPRQQGAAEFAVVTEKFPVTKDGRPPSPKQLARAGILFNRGYYDKWRFSQAKVREAYLLSHFTNSKPSVFSVARLIKKEGWKNNHPKPHAVVQRWKPLPSPIMNEAELVNDIKNQSWKGLTIKTFVEEKRQGVVATCRFAKGSVVCDYHGKIISAAEGRQLMEQSQVHGNRLFFFKDLCVDTRTVPCECHPGVDTFSERINRSSLKPNLKPVHHVLKADEQNVELDAILLRAIKDIEVGDELTF